MARTNRCPGCVFQPRDADCMFCLHRKKSKKRKGCPFRFGHESTQACVAAVLIWCLRRVLLSRSSVFRKGGPSSGKARTGTSAPSVGDPLFRSTSSPSPFRAPITPSRCRSITIPAKTNTILWKTTLFSAGEDSHHLALFPLAISDGDEVLDVIGSRWI
jgi:hypothetical protein